MSDGAWIALLAALGGCLLAAFGGFALGRRRVPGPDGGGRGLPAEVRPDASGATAAGPELSASVVEASHHGVVVVDRDERVLLANPAAQRMRVLSGRRLAFEALADLVRESAAGRTVGRSIDLPSERLGREPVAVSARAVPLTTERGRVTAVALLLDDVTDQRRLEDVRRDFVANVSHELKTPVGALGLLAEAVEDAADEPEDVARFAARMQRESHRLGRLVQELIELSRLQGAEPLPGDSRVRIDDVLAEAVDRTRLIAEQAGITVVVRCDGELRVRGNESQLATAVTNLVDNAVAYSPRATRVAVNARRAADDRDTVEISVSDQGIGMPESELTRVFERFYRVDPARSRATGGTGLGLAIVKHVVSNHGGTTSVWSVEGAGSTFTIRLPLVHLDASPSPSDRPVETPKDAYVEDRV